MFSLSGFICFWNGEKNEVSRSHSELKFNWLRRVVQAVQGTTLPGATFRRPTQGAGFEQWSNFSVADARSRLRTTAKGPAEPGSAEPVI